MTNVSPPAPQLKQLFQYFRDSKVQISFSVGSVVKNLPANAGDTRDTVLKIRKIPWRRKWQPTAIFLPGKSHGQRSPAGYSPQDLEESDVTEHSIAQGTDQASCSSVN